MKLFIKISFYKNSKYLAHLLEHTMWSYKNYFEISEIDFYTFNDYILLDFPNYLDIEKIKNIVFKKPDRSQIEYEKQILKDEFLQTNIKLKIEHKIWKILFWSDFNTIKNSQVSYKEIINYHKKYFNKENILITDDEYNIFEDNIFSKYFEKNITFSEDYFSFKVDNFPCFLFVKKIENYLDYYLFFFLEFFYENLFSYEIRFKEWFYYYDHFAFSSRIYNVNIFCITCEFLDFDEIFFEKSKERFLEIIEKWYWRKWKVICKMIYWEDINFKEIKNFIKNLKSDYFKKLKNRF